MATYRKVPAQIILRDYIGISTIDAEKYRKLGERELTKLEGQVLRGSLDQGVRRVDLCDEVQCEAIVIY